MVMVASFASTTVTVAVPLTPLSEAVMVAIPGASPVTSPSLPGALETDATFAALEVHATLAVMSTVVLLLKRPRAVRRCVGPPTMSGVMAGVTSMDVSVAEVTVKLVVPTMGVPPWLSVAVMAVVPAAKVVPLPVVPILATAAEPDAHCTELVTSRMTPSS
jgi:hypothetical protein